MKSRLLKKLGVTAPVVSQPIGEMSYEEARADYEKAVADEAEARARLSGGLSPEEVEADLFRSEEEDDREIQAMIEDDPEGEKGKPWEQVKAEGGRLLEELVAAAHRRVAAKRNLSKYDR